MWPCEALYARSCRTSQNWSESSERVIFGSDLVKDAEEKVHLIQQTLERAKSRQISYTNKRRRSLNFEVGDQVYLRVSPTKGVQHFRIEGKLAPQYIGPFPIQERCGPVAYHWNYRHIFAESTMSFMSPNWRDFLKSPMDIEIFNVE